MERRASPPDVARAAPPLIALAMLSACGSYVSDYVPPADGRARVIWHDGKPVMDLGRPITGQCVNDVLSYSRELPLEDGRDPGRRTSVSNEFWVPVYYGPRSVVIHRGVAPPPPAPARRTGTAPNFHGRGVSGTGATNATNSSGVSASGDKYVLVTLAVIAIVALPAIAFGLSLGRTEPENESATEIDHVNAYNDLSRTAGSACAFQAPGTSRP